MQITTQTAATPTGQRLVVADQHWTAGRPLVTVDGNKVRKEYRPEFFDAEVTKALLVYTSSDDESFIAPAVLDVDPDQHTIVYERVDCGRNLLDAMADVDESRGSIADLLHRTGVALAAIHAIVAPPESVAGVRAPLFTPEQSCLDDDDASWVLQHGDFGFTNIFVAGSDLVVIDPSPNDYTSLHPLNVDVPELDLAILLSHLLGRVANPRALGRAAVFGRELVGAALTGYTAGGGVHDRERLRDFTMAGIQAVRDHRSPGAKAHRLAMLKPVSTLLGRNLS